MHLLTIFNVRRILFNCFVSHLRERNAFGIFDVGTLYLDGLATNVIAGIFNVWAYYSAILRQSGKRKPGQIGRIGIRHLTLEGPACFCTYITAAFLDKGFSSRRRGDYQEIGGAIDAKDEDKSGIINLIFKIATVKVIFLALDNFYRRFLHEKSYNNDGGV